MKRNEADALHELSMNVILPSKNNRCLTVRISLHFPRKRATEARVQNRHTTQDDKLGALA